MFMRKKFALYYRYVMYIQMFCTYRFFVIAQGGENQKNVALINPLGLYMVLSKNICRCSPTFGGVTFGTLILKLKLPFIFNQFTIAGYSFSFSKILSQMSDSEHGLRQANIG